MVLLKKKNYEKQAIQEDVYNRIHGELQRHIDYSKHLLPKLASQQMNADQNVQGCAL